MYRKHLDETYSFAGMGPLAGLKPSEVLYRLDDDKFAQSAITWALSKGWICVNGDFYYRDALEQVRQDLLSETEYTLNELTRHIWE